MRKLKPFISIEKVAGTNDKFRVHALVFLEKDQKIEPQELTNLGVHEKQRKDGSIIKCTTFKINIVDNHHTGSYHPVYLNSGVFERDPGINNVWVYCDKPIGGNPEDGGVGNYDDSDGDV